MSNKQFIDWLKGFTEGVHHYNISPKQWDELKSKLQTVENSSQNKYGYPDKNWVTTTTF